MLWEQMLAFNVLNASIPLLVDIYDAKYRAKDLQQAFPDDPEDLNLPVRETFDFIIAGGGTAGLILARRLSDANHRVLVLEAGGNQPPLENSVYAGRFMYNLPKINFVYSTVPQKNAALPFGGVLQTTSGRMLGGSSAHNDGQYERCSPFDYNQWADVTGDDSWRYENLLQYFLKLENYHGQFSTAEGQHNEGGLVTVRKMNTSYRDDVWFEAGRELGYQRRDSNGPQHVGFSPSEYITTLDKTRRISTYSAYIQPIEERRKEFLTIRRYSVVSGILFEGNQAIGVTYERHGIQRVAFASKEVLLCAGVFISPMILIRSGIGPEEELKKAKVIFQNLGQSVLGVNGLRVVDGSIMPFVVNANSMVPVFVIAEKAATDILNYWKGK